jgi:acyl transferase domain-containing protein/NAD(P)-dependent dehydrogenase (short-subunit alcohol dehydrogenase family)
MKESAHRAVAIVGVGSVLPDAPSAAAFWENLKAGRYSISETPENRWNVGRYYDPDPGVPDKSYSKIGGWVKDWEWNPMKWRLPIPPTVGDQMDLTQKWAIAATREALTDYGYPERPLDTDRTAVVIGNAMSGDRHYLTSLRIYFPEFANELEHASSFRTLSPELQREILAEVHRGMDGKFPVITEDTMPGELANVIAGRIANLFNFHGPNFVVDAACASAMAGITAAIEGLEEGDYDAVITGGVDANMGASTFVKFCKIGALSATGTRPYAEGADGFVMGEGTALFVLKRLADAEKNGDKIYAVIRGLGGSSDGKGKGITAPNPIGQKLCIERAWKNAGIDPASASMLEGHGTSTKVGDVIETESLAYVFGGAGAKQGSIPLGSVKSNIGHLKGAAGAAGILKVALSLHHKLLPPSVNFAQPNPNIAFGTAPFHVNTELKPWDFTGTEGVRRAGVSAFGFGGTNFHTVVEEYIPGRLTTNGRTQVGYTGATRSEERGARSETGTGAGSSFRNPPSAIRNQKVPLRGALVIGGASVAEIRARLETVRAEAEAGRAPAPQPPAEQDLRAPVRLAIDYGDAAELAAKAVKAVKALDADNIGMWKALRAQGVFLGRGPAPKVAFLYTGQGSQYVNMLKGLRVTEPIVARAFEEADTVMTPILGRPLSSFIFIDADDEAAVKQLEHELKQTEITQPAVLATDEAMTRVLAAYGIEPDMVMGHSLGEYGALVASGAMSFADALRAVSARGHAMKEVSLDDNGLMAAVFAPIEKVEEILASVDDYVVPANINSRGQAVIGGSTSGVQKAMAAFSAAGFQVAPLPVSHAFHTRIVAPASEPLRHVLEKLDIHAPAKPIVANVTGRFYPMNATPADMVDILAKQVASPVQFVDGLKSLYEAGARVFVEAGPKKALHGFVEDVLGDDPTVLALFTNHPKAGDVVSLNQALCGLYASGLGASAQAAVVEEVAEPTSKQVAEPAAIRAAQPPAVTSTPMSDSNRMLELGRLFADFLDRGRQIYEGHQGSGPRPAATGEPTVVTGAALGLPGTERVFDDANIARLLRGDQFIDAIPTRLRGAMVDKHITRLVKSEKGEPRFEVIDDAADVLKLAGRAGTLDLIHEFGFPEERLDALESTTQLAIAAGIDALRDAGIPLAMRYKTTTRGTKLPERWMLPEALRDDTGVIFASAFPGYDAFADEMARYARDHALRQRLADLRSLRERVTGGNGGGVMLLEIDRRINELETELESAAYVLDRKLLFRILSMGHSQFAEYIGARGPNTQVNAACASTTQAVAISEDWIREGRCRRVIVVSADNVTSDHLMEWIGAGFLASGAAATDETVEAAALPFDRRRHGMIPGMGAAAMVIESAEAARERGIRPIVQVLGAVTANSAFHGTRLDVDHICQVMENLVSQAEQKWGIDRRQIAPHTVFVSHETYTPARGGSAQAEINALRHVFGPAADQVVIANTKGFTGHAMGAGVEDVLAIKALETGVVPPVANFKEIDPDLGSLNLSRGGAYPVQFALRLGAGFGSQISMTLSRWVPTPSGVRPTPNQLGFGGRIADEGTWATWLRRVSGYEVPEIEVVQRTLRIKHQGAPQFEVRTQPATRPAAIPVAPPQPAFAAAPAAPAPAPAAPAVAATMAAPAPVAAPAAAAPAPAAAPATDPIQARVLELVAEQTGYPTDMLDLDLDLEADLGVDTVKQAEMFVAVRGEWGIERDENLKLRDFPTLRHVIGFVFAKRPELKQAAPAPAPAAPTAPAATTAPTAAAVDAVQKRVLELVAQQTGYPEDMLDLDLDLEADLGVDTVKQAEMFVAVRGEWGIERDENLKLRDFPTLRHVIGFVYSKRPELKQAAPAPAPAPAAAPVAEAAPMAAGTTADPIQTRVLELVAQQTGYPEDMLDLDLDLEADLGVDTVKQAEMFVAVRGEWGIERDENLQLRDFPTLRHVIGFVYAKRPELKQAAPAPAAAAAPVAAATDAVQQRVLELVAHQTGYPQDMLDLDLDLEADLGVDTVKQAEMFVAVRGEWGIERDENLQLRDFPTLRHVIGFVYAKRPDLKQAAPAPAPAAAPPPAPAAPSAAPAAATGAPVADAIQERVLELVAEQTGYPKDMLDLELDLEADLGIDTVKQAEMFVKIRGEWNIPRDENLQLREFPTLKHVIGFVYDRAPSLAAAAAAATVQAFSVVAEAVMPTAPAQPKPATFEAAAEVPRRVPVAVLRPSLELCKETGVTLAEGSRVVVMLDQGGVGQALVTRLQKRGVEALVIDDAPDAETLRERLEAFAATGAVTGVYWLPALDEEAPVEQMELSGWRESLRVRVKLLYTTARTLYESLAGTGAFLVAGTRLGGQHGYDEAGAVAPLGGAVTGFVKTLKRERPDALIKAVDFAASRKTASLADRLIDETLRDPGIVEVGYRDDLRWGITFEVQPIPETGDGMKLDSESVFVITGAAGSIVSAITQDLASASGGVFYLMDLVPEPDRGDDDIRRFVSDKEGLKRDIFERLKASGERATPAMVEKELAKLERAHAALTAIQAVENAGGTAHYSSVNLLDAEGIRRVIETVRERHGRIDVLLHAGGLEISRLLPDKKPEEFDLVFDVKADGWFNLLHAIGDMPLGATVGFSSVAGRFGNGGQADYSAANDLLCKFSSNFRTRRPGTRGIALDWTAWGGIGMATRGSIPKMMEAAGIDMLPPEAGVPFIRRELVSGAWSGEIVVGLRLGILVKPWDETGGLDVAALAEQTAGPVSASVRGFDMYDGLVVDTTLDPKEQPFLDDHRIDGVPVLPGVMGMESFAEAARRVFPDRHVAAVEDVRFLAPFKFYRDEPRTATVYATFRTDGSDVVADCRLEGRRELPKGVEVTTHFAARVRLAMQAPEGDTIDLGSAGEGTPVGSADIYRIYFHGPAYQVLDHAWSDGEVVIGMMAADLPPNHLPADLPLLTAPRLSELCFQTAGIHEIGTTGRMGLPLHIDRVKMLRATEQAEGRLLAQVRPSEDGVYHATVADEAGNVYLRMSGYRTVELPVGLDAEALKPLSAAMKPEGEVVV